MIRKRCCRHFVKLVSCRDIFAKLISFFFFSFYHLLCISFTFALRFLSLFFSFLISFFLSFFSSYSLFSFFLDFLFLFLSFSFVLFLSSFLNSSFFFLLFGFLYLWRWELLFFMSVLTVLYGQLFSPQCYTVDYQSILYFTDSVTPQLQLLRKH